MAVPDFFVPHLSTRGRAQRTFSQRCSVQVGLRNVNFGPRGQADGDWARVIARILGGAGPRFLTARFALPPALSTLAPFGRPCLWSLGQAWRPAVSELLAGDRSAPGKAVCICANCVNLFARAPAPPGSLGGCVHPPPAGAASDPTCMTPHDSALGGPNAAMINPPRRARISFRPSFVLVYRRRHRGRDAACRWRPSFAMVGARGRSSMVERQLPNHIFSSPFTKKSNKISTSP